MSKTNDEKLEVLIGQNSFIKGTITSKSGLVRVDGIVEGDISTVGKVTCGGTGKITGNIKCENAIIGGRIEGNIEVNNEITIETKAYVEGDIICKAIIIERGVYFNGRCIMDRRSKERNESKAEKKEKEKK